MAFLLGAAVGAAGPSPLGRLLRSTAASAGVVALGLLGLLAVAAGPSSSLWRDGAALASPILAALAVAWAAPALGAAGGARRPPGPRSVGGPGGGAARARPGAGAGVAGQDPPAVGRSAGGGHRAGRRGGGGGGRAGRPARPVPAALERRRVLLPPAFVAVLILILSATGAFHWEHTRPLTPEEIRTRTSQGGS
ncbi:MAG: hypothetical protein R2746_05065 [Acidimicrobiales bacterium]